MVPAAETCSAPPAWTIAPFAIPNLVGPARVRLTSPPVFASTFAILPATFIGPDPDNNVAFVAVNDVTLTAPEPFAVRSAVVALPLPFTVMLPLLAVVDNDKLAVRKSPLNVIASLLEILIALLC